jgi:hypothetical protein
VHITFGIHPLLSTKDLFNTWSNILRGRFIGHYGLVEMILSLIKLQSKLFCRYFTEERIGSGIGCN